MRPPRLHSVWLIAAWLSVLAGPAAALAFILQSTPSIHCEPKLQCLRDAVHDAWSTFLHRLLILLSFGCLLGLAPLLLRAAASRTTAILRASFLGALLSLLVALAVRTGMEAVLEEPTPDATLRLLVIALGSIPAAATFWRTLTGIPRQT